MKERSKKIAFLGLCTALALVLAYVEMLLPPLFPAIPGIKIGLPNIIIVFLLYRYGAASALSVSVMRIILVSVLFGNITTFLYSLSGGVLSLTVMIVLRKWNILSELGVSVAGGVTHNIGQILMAMLLLETAELGYYLVALVVTGTVAGVFVGLSVMLLMRRIPKKLF